MKIECSCLVSRRVYGEFEVDAMMAHLTAASKIALWAVS